MAETGIDSRSDLPNREIRWRLVSVVDSGVVDVWLEKVLWLLIGINLGMWMTDKPQPEMAIMLERLKAKTTINYLESVTNERTQAVRAKHGSDDEANQTYRNRQNDNASIAAANH